MSAPLRPGDSGGPLTNESGETIGIDTAASLLYRFEPTAADTGFAIPIERATAIAKEIESGRASNGIHVGPTAFLGITFQPASIYGGLTPGLTIDSVVTGSPAAKAGLRAGDLLTSLDGVQTATPAGFETKLLATRPGSQLQLGWSDLTGGSHNAAVTTSTGPAE